MIMSEQRLIFISGAYREKVVSGQQGQNYMCEKRLYIYNIQYIVQEAYSSDIALLKDIDKLAVGHSGQTSILWAKPSIDKKMRRLSRTIAVLCKEYIYFK